VSALSVPDFHSAVENASIDASAAIDHAADAVSDFLRALISRFTPLRAASATQEKSAPITTPPPVAQPATTTIVYQTITQPVIERVVERGTVLGASTDSDAVTQDELDAALNAVRSQFGLLSASIGANTFVSTPTFAQSQRIDTLSNIILNGVSGLTDADIPDGVTASNYLLLTGGTLSGDFAVTGNFTVAGAQTLSGAITIPYLVATSSTASSFAGNLGVGTTTPWRALSINGSSDLGTNALAGYFTATSSTASVFPYASTTAVTVSSAAYFPGSGIWNGSGNVGIATTSPSKHLSVGSDVGGSSAYFAGYVGIGTNNPLVGLEIRDPQGGKIRLGQTGFSYWDIKGVYSDTNSDLTFSSGSSEKLRFNTNGQVCIGYSGTNCTGSNSLIASGNVGIGTTAPWAKLSVTNTGSGPSFVVEDSTSPDSTPFIIDASGNVGIGTTSPAALLHLYDNQSDTPGLILDTGQTSGNGGALLWRRNNVTKINQYLDSSDNWRIQVGGSDRLTVNTAGNVGIGTTNPNEGKVEVKGGTVCVDTNSDDTASSCIASESDERLKQNVQTLDASASLDTLLNLNPVSFDWRATDPEVLKHYPLIARFAFSTHSVGLIAQEVQPLFPLAIEQETVGDSEVQYFQLDYTKFIPLIISSIKELYAQVLDVKNTVVGFAQRLVSDEIVARNRLCVEDICVTRDQFQAMVSNAGAASPATGGPASPAPTEDADGPESDLLEVDAPPIVPDQDEDAPISEPAPAVDNADTEEPAPATAPIGGEVPVE
jgi:hypothetical protein